MGQAHVTSKHKAEAENSGAFDPSRDTALTLVQKYSFSLPIGEPSTALTFQHGSANSARLRPAQPILYEVTMTLGQFFVISLLAAGFLSASAQNATLRTTATNASMVTYAGDEASDPAAANFQGKIVSLNGSRFILRDDANATWYHLDDQKAAAAFAGKKVVVIGVLDSRSDLIRVRSIHESA